MRSLLIKTLYMDDIMGSLLIKTLLHVRETLSWLLIPDELCWDRKHVVCCNRLFTVHGKNIPNFRY